MSLSPLDQDETHILKVPGDPRLRLDFSSVHFRLLLLSPDSTRISFLGTLEGTWPKAVHARTDLGVIFFKGDGNLKFVHIMLTWYLVSKSSNAVALWRDVYMSVVLIIIPKDWNPRDWNAKSLSSHWKEAIQKRWKVLLRDRSVAFCCTQDSSTMFPRVNSWKLVLKTVGCAVKIFLQEVHVWVRRTKWRRCTFNGASPLYSPRDRRE